METYNAEKRSEIQSLISDVLKEAGYVTSTACVEIAGRREFNTSDEVRALQLIALRKANESEEAYRDFCNNIVIYKDHTRTDTLTILPDGRLSEPFTEGFKSVDHYLTMQLFKEAPILD